MSMSPINQPFHILKKDATHLWPETLVSLALLATFAWTETQTWLTLSPEAGFNVTAFAAGILKLLLPVSWLVLTSRLVHDEELVGDRQFWTTRPYTWYSLLAAKVLYLVLFLCVPFVIMQTWMLHRAGLYPTHVFGAIFSNLGSVSVAFLLPMLVIAAVTATFVRYASSFLGGFLYAFAVVAFAFYFFPNNMDVPFYSRVLGIVFIVFPLAALFIQYARRKTMVARLILVALPLVFFLLIACAPVDIFTQHRYPDTSVGSLTFNADEAYQQPAGRLVTFQHKNQVELPVHIALNGVPTNGWVEVQRLRATIDGPGIHYVGGWISAHATLMAARPDTRVPVELPEKIYNQIHDKPVSVHVTLGVQVFEPGTPYNIKATETAFPIPGNASCTVSVDNGALECRHPFANATFTEIQATVHNGNCLVPGPATGMAFGSLPATPGVFGFTPVEMSSTHLAVGQTPITLCPGTPITFTPVMGTKYARMSLDIPTVTLAPYARRIPVQDVQHITPGTGATQP